MKINLPLTGQERLFAAGRTLVSRTDTKGIITFANDGFVEVSGFSREELVGENHNIIRHPDVPPIVFETMWQTLKRGLPWHGTVKNRCKNGDHYWVDARIVPVKKHGHIIGFMSVRTCPSRADVARAEAAFEALRHAPAAPAADAVSNWKHSFSIRNGVTLGIVFVTLLMIAGGILGITGLRMSNASMEALYRNELEPMKSIGRINFLMADNRAQVALALHHNLETHEAGSLGHDLASHIASLDRNRSEIDALWSGYGARIASDEERALADRYWQARNRYVQEGLLEARGALIEGDFRRAEMLLLQSVNPLYDAANREVTTLLVHLSARAQEDFDRLTRRNATIAAVAVAGIVIGSLAMVLAGLYFFRATVLPLQKAVKALENIAEGNLSEAVDDAGYGEPGRVMAAVTVMQMHLKVMMNEISQSSDSIREQCRNLNRTMMNVSEHTDEQHDRVYETLDAILGACDGLRELAEGAESLMTAEGAAAAAVPDVVGAARVQLFAVEDVAAKLRQVAALIVDNRAEVQGAWSASQQLEKTAEELDRLVKYFE